MYSGPPTIRKMAFMFDVLEINTEPADENFNLGENFNTEKYIKIE